MNFIKDIVQNKIKLPGIIFAGIVTLMCSVICITCCTLIAQQCVLPLRGYVGVCLFACLLIAACGIVFHLMLAGVFAWLFSIVERIWKKEYEKYTNDMEKYKHNLFYIIIGFLWIVLAVICGVFWSESECLKCIYAWILGSKIKVCISLIASLLIVLELIYSFHKPYFSKLWICSLPPVALFWLLAGGMHFEWKSLSSVIWCVGVYFLLILPVLKVYQKSEGEPPVDTIGRRLLYLRMGSRIRYLIKKKGNKGLTVAVTGEWGSGKSHFINYLAYSLRQDIKGDTAGLANSYNKAFVVCSVDLWRCKDVKSMWCDIAMALSASISGHNALLCSSLVAHVHQMLSKMELPTFTLADSILQLVTSGVDDGLAAEEKLESRIDFPNKAYLLVLDNIDRCDSEIVNALFPILERLRKVKGLVTVCGIAERELERVGGKGNAPVDNLSDTVLKVFDVLLPLPRVSVRYVVPFMQRTLRESEIDSRNLSDWIGRQSLEFDTPRQMETVVAQLSLLDSCYLSRFYDSYSESNESRIDAAFYMMSLRVVFPKIASILEHADRPKELLSRTYSALSEILPWCSTEIEEHIIEDNESDESRGQSSLQDREDECSDNAEDSARQKLAKIWSVDSEIIVASRLLRSLFKILMDTDERDLYFAIRQEYLSLSALTEEECERIIEKTYQSGKKPLQVLREEFYPQYVEEDEPMLYRCVLENSLSSFYDFKGREYMLKCLKIDIVHQEGKYREFLDSPELLLQLLNASYTAGSNISAQRKEKALEWQNVLKLFVSHCNYRIMREVVIQLAEFAQSGKATPQIKKFAPRIARLERDTKKENALDLCSDLLSIMNPYLLEGVLDGMISSRENWGTTMTYCKIMFGSFSQSLSEEMDRFISQSRVIHQAIESGSAARIYYSLYQKIARRVLNAETRTLKYVINSDERYIQIWMMLKEKIDSLCLLNEISQSPPSPRIREIIKYEFANLEREKEEIQTSLNECTDDGQSGNLENLRARVIEIDKTLSIIQKYADVCRFDIRKLAKSETSTI